LGVTNNQVSKDERIEYFVLVPAWRRSSKMKALEVVSQSGRNGNESLPLDRMNYWRQDDEMERLMKDGVESGK
jgi:hypothetical protein